GTTRDSSPPQGTPADEGDAQHLRGAAGGGSSHGAGVLRGNTAHRAGARAVGQWLQLHRGATGRAAVLYPERGHARGAREDGIHAGARRLLSHGTGADSRRSARRDHLRGRRIGAWRWRSALHDDAALAGRSVGLTVGVREIETTLVRRALSFLAAGPSDPVPLIEHVCQLPGAPRVVAEQMALALFADRPEFARDASGRWSLAPHPTIQSRDRATDDSAFRDELEALSYVVVDVETTGMNAFFGDRVTEIAAVVVRGGRIAEQFQTLVNPERPIPAMITALTHITPQMVRDAPRFREIAPELLQFLQGHVFVAHNAEFDWRFVSAEVARATNRQPTG